MLRSVTEGILAGFLAVVVLGTLTACSADKAGDTMPAPSMIVLAETNRMVWLGDTDDDQLTVGQDLWDDIATAEQVPGESEVSSETVNTVVRTGAMAGLYFKQGLPQFDGDPVGVILVLKPGDASGLEPGDVLHMFAKARYVRIGRLPEESLATAHTTVYHRMGLE